MNAKTPKQPAPKARRQARRVKNVSRATTPTGRHTPRPEGHAPSPMWLPVAIVALFTIGVVTVMAGYWGLPSGPTQLAVIALGALLVVAGFWAATRYR